MARNGILCIEGDWDPGLKQDRSVRPILELLNKLSGIKYIYRTATTREEFVRCFKLWLSRYKSYPILYLCYHGEEGGFFFDASERRGITLKDLKWLAKGKNGGPKRFMFFGSCRTLHVREREMRELFVGTPIVGACGYEEDVDFFESFAFEIIALNEFSKRKISRRNLIKGWDEIRKRAGGLTSALGAIMWFLVARSPSE